MFGFRAEQPLAEEIKRFAEENNMSKSDALKTLVREGLRTEAIEDDLEELRGEVSELRRQVGEKDGSGLFSWLR